MTPEPEATPRTISRLLRYPLAAFAAVPSGASGSLVRAVVITI